jgi:lysophospholipase L1-like esterase
MSLPNHPSRFGSFRLAPWALAFLLALAAIALAPSSSAQVKVMTNGDSITFGVGASNTETQSYSAELARLLGSGYSVRKDGTGGATLLRRGQPSFWNTQGIRGTTEMNPDAVFIMLGTNDSKSGNWLYRAEFVADYVALIDLYRALPAKPQIFLGLPPPATARNGDVDGPTVANEVIPRILEVARQRDVRVVDVHTPFLDPFRSLLPDGIHPNDEGHRVIARAVRDALVYGRAWRAVPAPWQRVDVGAAVFAGGDALDEADVFQVFGGGARIGDTSDAFRFVNQNVSGDIDLTARVAVPRNVDPLQATSGDAVAGLMIRENTFASARHVSVCVSPSRLVSFRWRDGVGLVGGSAVVNGSGSSLWLRLRRSGANVSAFYSGDGSNWIQVGSTRATSLPGPVLAGLAVNSARSDTLALARFEQVKLVVGGVIAPEPAPTTPSPAPAPTTPPPSTTDPVADAATANFDPSAADSRTLVGDAFAALLDPARTAWRFAIDQPALRPLRAAFPGTTRDSLSFDGSRMLPGPRTQDLFTPGVSQDMGFAGVVRVPAVGGSGKALLLTLNHSDTEPALALGYDYGLGRFYAVFLQAFNGAPSEIAGPVSPRGASYLVRLQKTGGVVRLRVNGLLMAETNTARPVLLASGKVGSLGLGGIRPLNPQFVGQLGEFHLRNSALGDAEAATLEGDLRAAWITTTATTPPPVTTPPPTTEPGTLPAGGAVFDPAALAGRTLVDGAYAELVDPARAGWTFATSESAIRPQRIAFSGTTRDALSFDGKKMLPGPRSNELFTPGVSQDLGIVAAVRIPASGGAGRACIVTINHSDTEPSVAVGYDYSANRFFATYPLAFNGAPGEIAGGPAPRGATYVVRLQKTGGVVRLRVNGALVAESAAARLAVLAPGQGGQLGIGGLRALNPQFVGQLGRFYLRNTALTDADAAALEADLREWLAP